MNIQDDTLKNQELKILGGQLLASSAYIIVLIVSIALLYNQILKIRGEEGFFSNDEAININLINRIVILLLVLYFLYTNYQNIEIAKTRKQETKFLNLQFSASFLTVIASIIVLYVSLNQTKKSGLSAIVATENPNL